MQFVTPGTQANRASARGGSGADIAATHVRTASSADGRTSSSVPGSRMGLACELIALTAGTLLLWFRYLESSIEGMQATMSVVLLVALVGSIISRFATLRFGWRVQRAVEVAEAMGEGRFDDNIPSDANGDDAGLMRALGAMQIRLRQSAFAEEASSVESIRIANAFEASPSRMLIVDNSGVIRHVNKAASELFGRIEGAIRSVVPGFAAARIVGLAFDAVFSKPDALRGGAREWRAPRSEWVIFGTQNLQVTVMPIYGAGGEQIGSVAEMVERTADAAIAGEITHVVNAAAEGDFSKRIRTDDKKEARLQISEGINRLVDVTATVLQETVHLLDAVANGDLTRTVDANFKGAFGQLKDGSNNAVQRLAALVKQIDGAADSINRAAHEINTSNGNLAARTESQAASLEETATSMEELTGTVRQNAESARQANQLVIGTSDIASRGGKVVGEVVNTMAAIDQSSKKIVDIIAVIDSIAFQTNILALNAAVEAARAGEQGRGFAVVAAEVRTLAQRSAAAAKEIKTLISDSVDKVGSGTKLVEQAGKTMDEILSSVKKVTDIMGEITAASVEQSTGIDQVNQAIAQMDDVTRQNAELVEQTTVAATRLQGQTDGLVRAVGKFVLKDRVKSAAADRDTNTAAHELTTQRKHGRRREAAAAADLTRKSRVAIPVKPLRNEGAADLLTGRQGTVAAKRSVPEVLDTDSQQWTEF